MKSVPSFSQIRKGHVALVLALFALLSWAYGAALDRHPTQAELSGIPLAIARDERVTGGLQMYLKLDGIPGNATEGKHKGEIDVDSYTWQQNRTQGSARSSMQPFVVTIPAGMASAKLFLQTAGAVKISRAVLSVRKAGTDSDFLTWILTDVMPIDFKTVGNVHGDGVSDQVSFSFGKIEYSYTSPAGEIVKAGWDQRTGKSVGY